MPLELVREQAAGAVHTVVLGRAKAVSLGGETAMPFLYEEGVMPHPPLVALEIDDCEPPEIPEALAKVYGAALKDPAAWARVCVEENGAPVLAIRLQSIHPDVRNAPAETAVAAVEKIRKAVDVPLVIVGCGDDERDNEVLPKVSQAMKGENCLLGIATQTNYKTLAATCLADGHAIIAESPIDINIAKQVNILITDMGFDPARIVMHTTAAAMGYGMEYVYSIMERSRLAAFIGDRMLAMPFVIFIGDEVWKVKEAREFGEVQGVNWEIASSVAMVQAGADLVVMRHPHAARTMMRYITGLAQQKRKDGQ